MMIAISAAAIILQLGWRAGTPAPILDGNPEWVALYWKAWETYHAGVIDEPVAGPLPPRFHGPDGRIAFDEAVTQALWTKWGWRAAPVIPTMRFVLSRVDNAGAVPAFVLSRDLAAVGTVDAPALIGWAVLEVASASGDDTFGRSALPPLMRLHARIASQFVGEESARRLPPDASLIPISADRPQLVDPAEPSALLILESEGMRRLARFAGSREPEAMLERFVAAESRRLLKKWRPELAAYAALDKDSGVSERVSLLSPWTALSDRRELTIHDATAPLESRAAFRTINPFPAVARGDAEYDPARGVKPLFQYLSLRSLLAAGKRADAGYAAEAMLRAYARGAGDGLTLFSEYAADRLEPAPAARQGALEAGYVVVAALIEALIGVTVSGREHVVHWKIWRTDRHGVERLRLGERTVSVECARRESRSDRAHITIECDGDFTLEVSSGGAPVRRKFQEGRHEWSPAI